VPWGTSNTDRCLGNPFKSVEGPEKYFDDTSCSIAVKAGIGESKHFSKAFKLVTGMTLMQFKKRK